MALNLSTLASNPDKLKKFAAFMEETGFIKAIGEKAQEFAKNLNTPAIRATIFALGGLLASGAIGKLLLSDETKRELGALGQIYTKTAKTVVEHYLPWLKDLVNKVKEFITVSKQKIDQLKESVRTLVEEVEERTFEISPVTYFIATLTQLPPTIVENFKYTLEKVFNRLEKRHRFIKVPLIIVKSLYRLLRHPRSTLFGLLSSLPLVGQLIARKFKKEDELWKQLIRTILPFILGQYGEKLADTVIEFVEAWLKEYKKKSKTIKQIKSDTSKLIGLSKLTLKTQFKPKLNLASFKVPVTFATISPGAIVGDKFTRTSKKLDLQSKVFLSKLDNLQKTEKKLLKETKEVSFLLKLASLLNLSALSFHLPKLPSIKTLFKLVLEWFLGKKIADIVLTKLLGAKWARFKRIVRVIWKRKILRLAKKFIGGLSNAFKTFVSNFFTSIARFFERTTITRFASFFSRFFVTLASRFLVAGGIVGIGLALYDLFGTLRQTLNELSKKNLSKVKEALVLLVAVKETITKWLHLVLAGIGIVFTKLYDLVSPVVGKVHTWLVKLQDSWIAKHIPFAKTLVDLLAKLTGSIYDDVKYFKNWWENFSKEHIKSAVESELKTEDVNKLINEVDNWLKDLNKLAQLLEPRKTAQVKKHTKVIVLEKPTSPIDFSLGVQDA